MFKQAPFSHNILRKYIAAVGTLFNDVQVARKDAEGDVQQVIDVTLTYARKEKILARYFGDPDIDKAAGSVLPRMSYELTDMVYDGIRKLGSTKRFEVRANTAGPGTYSAVWMPVPYDLKFKLYVAAKYQHDGNQIIEQIVPYFTPKFDMTIELVPELDIRVDVPVILDSVTCEDTYDGDYKVRRAITWTLELTAKAYLFGPVVNHPIIKFANVNLYDSTRFDDIGDAVGNSSPIDRVTVQPGQDANGDATTDITITIPFSEIEADEEWGYVVDIAGNLDPSEGTGGE